MRGADDKLLARDLRRLLCKLDEDRPDYREAA
jgi:hypothetical protein